MPRLWKYLTAAFNARPFGIFVPPNWISLAAAALLGVFVSPGFLVLGLGVELMYLFLVSTSDRFRNVIDGISLVEARTESEKTINGIISLLPPVYQSKFQMLAKRCGEMVKGGSSPEMQSVAHGLDSLLWIYVKLLKTAGQLEAISSGAAAQGKRTEIEQKIAGLRKQITSTTSDDLRNSMQGTLDALQSRLDIRQQATEKLTYCKSELQRIEEEVDRAMEQSLISTEPVAVSHQVDAIMSGLGSTSQWITEQQNIFGSLSGDAPDSGPILSLQ